MSKRKRGVSIDNLGWAPSTCRPSEKRSEEEKERNKAAKQEKEDRLGQECRSSFREWRTDSQGNWYQKSH